MTVKELMELLKQFDEDKRVCISDSSRHSGPYAYDIVSVHNASLSEYWSEDDNEKPVVRIQLGQQIGTLE